MAASCVRTVTRERSECASTRVGALLAVVQEALSRKPALLQQTDALARRFVATLGAMATFARVAGSDEEKQARGHLGAETVRAAFAAMAADESPTARRDAALDAAK